MNEEYDAARDLEFLENLTDYIRRRDEAMGLPIASDLLISLYSVTGGLTALNYFLEAERVNLAGDLYDLIVENKRKAQILVDKTQRLVNRQHLWKRPDTIEKNKRQVVDWFNEVSRLHEQARRAYESLKRADNG